MSIESVGSSMDVAPVMTAVKAKETYSSEKDGRAPLNKSQSDSAREPIEKVKPGSRPVGSYVDTSA